MFFRSPISHPLLADFNLFQRELASLLNDGPPNPQSAYPQLHVATTSTAVEVHALLPGLDPASLEIQLDRGVLSIAGERPAPAPGEAGVRRVGERFSGRFQRKVRLPDDVDASAVDASCRDGVLHIQLQRRAAEAARRIHVQ